MRCTIFSIINIRTFYTIVRDTCYDSWNSYIFFQQSARPSSITMPHCTIAKNVWSFSNELQEIGIPHSHCTFLKQVTNFHSLSCKLMLFSKVNCLWWKARAVDSLPRWKNIKRWDKRGKLWDKLVFIHQIWSSRRLLP